MDRRLKSEINRINSIMKNEPDEWYYWYGYSLGLSNTHQNIESKVEMWKNSLSKNLNEMYNGFRNARAWCRSKTAPGRPKKVDRWLNRLGVTKDVFDGLHKAAESLGISIPRVRRLAYEKFLEGNVKSSTLS